MKIKIALLLLISSLLLNVSALAQESTESTSSTEISTIESTSGDSIKNQKHVLIKIPADMVVVDSSNVKKKEGPEKEKSFNPLGGVDWFKGEDFLGLVIRLFIHMLFIFILVRLIYYPIAKRKDFLFTYFLFSISIFTMCFLLESVKLEMGFALGLFAVFGIIRYRTDAIAIKEMTYLFIVIGMSVMNALINKKVTIAELSFANLAIIALTYGLEKVWLLRHESQKLIVYERIDLIQQGRRAELLEDLQKRTGIKVNRIEIGKIDFLRDTVMLKIYFYEDQQEGQMDETFSSGFNN
ncbi:MAG: DUF4956 domain-containing protein [Flavobacteriales bacterium]|nr:DUF4956 domain-containing protein [Flavobacteriales bacterium]